MNILGGSIALLLPALLLQVHGFPAGQLVPPTRQRGKPSGKPSLRGKPGGGRPGYQVITQLPVLHTYTADSHQLNPSETNAETLVRIHRQEEYYSTLTYNLAKPFVAGITILLERASDEAEIRRNVHSTYVKKLNFVPIGRRTTYKDLFQYAGSVFPGKTVIITHADIELESGFERLAMSQLSEPTVVALVRSFR